MTAKGGFFSFKVRRMKYRRVLAIGDIHGNFSRLLKLIHKVNFDPTQDFLILLGDYIDRGDENMRCLRWAIEMSEKPTFDVESGSVLTVSGRYRNGTRQTAELDKGSIVSVGVPK